MDRQVSAKGRMISESYAQFTLDALRGPSVDVLQTILSAPSRLVEAKTITTAAFRAGSPMAGLTLGFSSVSQEDLTSTCH